MQQKSGHPCRVNRAFVVNPRRSRRIAYRTILTTCRVRTRNCGCRPCAIAGLVLPVIVRAAFRSCVRSGVREPWHGCWRTYGLLGHMVWSAGCRQPVIDVQLARAKGRPP